jgi:hypothetical protein
VTAHLLSLIGQQAADHGIVVWYDPEGVYAHLVEGSQLGEVPLLRYAGSFLELRERLEPYLEFVGEDDRIRAEALEPRPVVVYVPLDRQATRYALVEAEAAGVVMEPGGHPWQRNTRLRVLAERVLQEVAPERAADWGRQAEQGILALADLDRLADQSSLDLGAVRLVFESTSPAEIALAFLASDRHDAALQQRRALPELTGVLRAEVGLVLNPEVGPAALRQAARRALLLTEFRGTLPAAVQPGVLENIPLPESPVHVEAAGRLCHTWRNRADYSDAYVEAARAVESELGASVFELSPDVLGDLDTFAAIETRLLRYAGERLLAGETQAALALAAKRKNSFWSGEDPSLRLRWTLLETVGRLLTAARQVNAELRAGRRNAEALVRAYAEGESPWCRLDTEYRHLERQFTTFDLEMNDEHDQLERLVHHARQAYVDALGQCAGAFTAALEAAGFEVPGVLRQRDVFQKQVNPVLHGRGKVAYVLVDGLRFEMARELVGGMGDEASEVRLHAALAQLPSLTAVGMAALLPGSEKALELAESGGELVVRVDGRPLKDRAARVRLLRDLLGGRFVELKLNDLVKSVRKVQEMVQSAEVVLVTSQEIDRRGEESADEDEARRYMDEVLDKLRRGVRRLAALGVTTCVLTADHGHLFVEGLTSGMKIDPPGGRTVELHRRVWLGHGGQSAPGYIRVAADKLGLKGDLEFAFPRELACFKVRGGSEAYFHGGASLQEMVIPVAVLQLSAGLPAAKDASQIELAMDRPRVTTRFFSVTATYRPAGLFPAAQKRVVFSVRAGRKEVGTAAMAAYGFEGATQEVVLEPDRPNAITLMLTEEPEGGSVSVHVLDAASRIEQARWEQLPVTIHMR